MRRQYIRFVRSLGARSWLGYFFWNAAASRVILACSSIENSKIFRPLFLEENWKSESRNSMSRRARILDAKDVWRRFSSPSFGLFSWNDWIHSIRNSSSRSKINKYCFFFVLNSESRVELKQSSPSKWSCRISFVSTFLFFTIFEKIFQTLILILSVKRLNILFLFCKFNN